MEKITEGAFTSVSLSYIVINVFRFLCICVFLFVFCHYVFNVFLSLCASTAFVTHRQTRQQVVCDVIWGTYKCAVCLLDLPEEETNLGNRTHHHWQTGPLLGSVSRDV